MGNRIRGVRQNLAAGYILGRVGLTPGPVKAIRIAEAMQQGGSAVAAVVRAHQTDNTINGIDVQVDDTVVVADKDLLQYISANGDWEYKSVSKVLDSIGATQGFLLYRNATGWVALAVGTAGQLLQSGGAAANLSWATVILLPNYTVATLPAAPAVGATAFVTDSNQTMAAGIGLAVAAGGASKVPVYYDGAWKIG